MSKKIVVPARDLPPLIGGQTDVFLRFRIVSSDRNRVSAWTPIFSATPTIPFVTTDITNLQNNVIALQTDLGLVENDVAGIQGDVTQLYEISEDNFAISAML